MYDGMHVSSLLSTSTYSSRFFSDLFSHFQKAENFKTTSTFYKVEFQANTCNFYKVTKSSTFDNTAVKQEKNKNKCKLKNRTRTRRIQRIDTTKQQHDNYCGVTVTKFYERAECFQS